MTVVLPLLAVVNAALVFHPVALGWDAAEYVWVVQANMLPHSPYVGYLLLGELLSVFLPVAIALSALSTAAYAGSVVLVCLIVSRLGEPPETAVLGGLAFMAFPVCIAYAGIQEVYAPQTFVVLLSVWLLLRGSRVAVLLSGLAFAFAMTVHNGTLFTLPAFVYLLLWKLPPESRWRRLAAWVLPNVVVAGVVIAVMVWIFRGEEAPVGEAIVYLRGIAPFDVPFTIGGFFSGLVGGVGSFFAPRVTGTPWIALVMLAGAVHAAVRSRSNLVFWALFSIVYVLYEAALQHNLEPGLYMPYVAPTAAALAAYGVVAVKELIVRAMTRVLPPARARVVGILAIVVVGLAVTGFYAANLWYTVGRHPRQAIASFGSHPLIVASRWIDENMPEDTIVVQSSGVDNVNLLPSQHLRRPIIRQDGRWLLLKRYRDYTPMNLGSYERLTQARLEALLAEGRTVVVYDTAVVDAFEGIASVPLTGGQPLHRLKLRGNG